MTQHLALLFFIIFLSPFSAYADGGILSLESHEEELNPFASDIDSKLEELDEMYAGPESEMDWGSLLKSTPLDCRQAGCPVFLYVSRSRQTADLYLNGVYHSSFLVSTGARGYATPNFDRHPNGRIYDRYSSTKFPGGDYQGYGNMPFAVFIQGGFAIHGTPESNWKHLGTPASHGCIRSHPENGRAFNRLVRQVGVLGTWITVAQ